MYIVVRFSGETGLALTRDRSCALERRSRPPVIRSQIDARRYNATS